MGRYQSVDGSGLLFKQSCQLNEKCRPEFSADHRLDESAKNFRPRFV
ncbi:Unknown protein sequence [Pseudomonas syringae pv. maculicola str. M6]|nr:Unknown protein sequence [Pseudomonas syringae pv. maculicola str. M6]